MDSFTCNALEFHKILEHLAGFCLSEAGQECVLLLRPMQNLDHINHVQKIFSTYGIWKSKGDFTLIDFPSIKNTLKLLMEGKFHPEIEDFWAFREVLKLAKNATLSILQHQNELPELFDCINFPFPELSLSALTRCVSDDGTFKDESSPGLLLIRTEIRTLHQNCLRKAKQYTDQYNISHYLQDDYITIRSDRYVLPLKANFKGRLQGIIHDYSHSGETLYFEPMFLVDLNNRLQELKQEEREEERKIIRLIMELLTQEADSINKIWNVLLDFDINEAKHRLSHAYTTASKKINQNSLPSGETSQAPQGRCVEFSSLLNLLKAYHPLLLLENNKTSSPKDIRSIDLIFRQEDKILVISGGNAGGKTVALKTLGLICLMSLSGLPVPVGAGSSLIPWQHVHAFIGDEQSLDEHVSTFTGQIQHLANIWETLDDHHLLLLDEFGAGTDPSQGAALAQAVLDGIIEKNAYAVSATHFPALKTYALTKDHVRAASVLFNNETKKPLFQLAYDQIGSSQALDVAKEHGLAKSILDQASRYLLLDTNDNQVVMEKLNSLAVEREKDLYILQEQIERTKEKRRKIQEQFVKEQERLSQELREKSRELMAAWKSEKISTKQTMKEISTLRTQINPHHEEESNIPLPVDTYKVGMEVMHVPWNKKGIIQEIDEKNKRIKINIGGISMWANTKDIGTSQSQPSQETHQKNIHFSRPNLSFALDLRGKRADLAISELTQFLDNALLSGPEQVEIIHGKGTGALRKCVHQFLKTYPNCSYSLATEEHGGDGMTLVYFK